MYFCNTQTPNEENKTLEFFQYLKSIYATFIIYGDTKTLLEKNSIYVKLVQKIRLQQK